MARKGGWRREGSKRHFRYLDARGNRISDEAKLERIRSLMIPPAWTDVWISPNPGAKLQATGVDAAGRRQYLYHPSFRAQQEQAKYDKLICFAERLPDLRAAMAEHIDRDSLDRERVAAIAVRLINRAWFRVGSERYARESKTFGITTLTKRHVTVRGHKIGFHFRGKHKVVVRTTLVDQELAEAMNELLALRGGRHLFRYERDRTLYHLTGGTTERVHPRAPR
jgi:DNA topoisomerase I